MPFAERPRFGLGELVIAPQTFPDNHPKIRQVVYDEYLGFHNLRFHLQASTNREKIARCSGVAIRQPFGMKLHAQ